MARKQKGKIYIVYELMSPSCGVYYGLTSTSLEIRWREHKRVAKNGKHHPLYDAIRKYGDGAFRVRPLVEGLTMEQAQNREIQEIALAHTLELKVYNLSPGGEADAGTGRRLFWERLAKDPAARDAYLAKLSTVKKSRDWSDYEDLSQKALKWRKENPKEAYKTAKRANRVSLKAPRDLSAFMKASKTPEALAKNSESQRKRYANELPSVKKRRQITLRRTTTEQWAGYTPEQKEKVVDKIRNKALERFKNTDQIEKVSKQLVSSREKIDRVKQAKNASKGLKDWWVELRKDPVKYAEYIASRQASKKKT